VGLHDLNTMLEPSARATLSPDEAQVLAQALGQGLHQVFLLYLAIALAGLVVVWFVPPGRLGAQVEATNDEASRLAAAPDGGTRGS
jgi:hypothetical protein